jgi:hypothetical protein
MLLELPAPLLAAGPAKSVISTAGNYDDDNLDDLAVAVSGVDPNTDGVYVLFGRTDWDTFGGVVDVVADADLVFRGFAPGEINVASAGNAAVDTLATDDLLVSAQDGLFLFEGRSRSTWDAANTLLEEHFIGSTTANVFVQPGGGTAEWTRSLTAGTVQWNFSTLRDSGALATNFAPGDPLQNGAIYFGDDPFQIDPVLRTFQSVGSASHGTATTASFDIPVTARTATLEFNYFLDTEDLPGLDVARVLVNGTPLAGATNEAGGSLDDTVNADGSFRGDTTNGWRSASFDLSQFIGQQNVTISFEFDSVDEFANDGEGWFIDDVVVTALGFTPDDAVKVRSGGQPIQGARIAGVGDTNGSGVDDIVAVTDDTVYLVYGRPVTADQPAVCR